MPNDLDLQQILGLLTNLLGGGAQQRPLRYAGLPMHFTQSYKYQPGFAETIFDMISPYREKLAPPTVLQSDWTQMVRMSQLRTKTQFSMLNPMATRATTMFLDKIYEGKGAQKLSEFQQQHPFVYNWMYKPAMGAMFGPGVAEDRARAYEDVHRFFMGRTFQMPSGQTRMGLPTDAAKQVTSRLYGLAYRDTSGTGLFRRFPHFGALDMADIMRMGLDYGMQVPTVQQGPQRGQMDVNKLVEQTKGLAKVIDAGMAVYKTLDKEKVIENLMELTRGRVPITDTVTMENMLYKLNSMARTLGVSTQYMQRIGVQGAKMFEQLGLPGDVGGFLGAGAMQVMGMATRGPGAAFTPADVARLGGTHRMRERFLVQMGTYVTSPAFQQAGLYYAATQAGMMPGRTVEQIRAGVIAGTVTPPELRTDIRRRLVSDYRRRFPGMTQDQIENMTAMQMEDMTRTGRGGLARDIERAGGTLLFQRAQAVSQLREIMGSRFQGEETLDRLRNDDQFKRDAMFMTAAHYRRIGIHPGQELEQAKQLIGSLRPSMGQLRDEQGRVMSHEILSRSMQSQRERTSIFRNVKEAFAFREHPGLWAALKMGIPGSTLELFRSPTGKKRISKEAFMSFFKRHGGVRGAAARVLDLSATPELEAITRGMGYLTGMGAFEFERSDAAALMSDVEETTSSYKVMDAARREKAFRQSMEGVAGEKFSLENAKDYLTDAGFKFSNFVDYLNTVAPKDKQYKVYDALKNSKVRKAFASVMGMSLEKSSVTEYMSMMSQMRALDANYDGKLISQGAKGRLSEKEYKKQISEIEIALTGGTNLNETDGLRIMYKRAEGFYDSLAQSAQEHLDKAQKMREEKFEAHAKQIFLNRDEFAKRMTTAITAGKDITPEDAQLILKEMNMTEQQAYNTFIDMSDAVRKGDLEQIRKAQKQMFLTDKSELKRGQDSVTRAMRLSKTMGYIMEKHEGAIKARRKLVTPADIARDTGITQAGAEEKISPSAQFGEAVMELGRIAKTAGTGQTKEAIDSFDKTVGALKDMLKRWPSQLDTKAIEIRKHLQEISSKLDNVVLVSHPG